MFWFSSCKCFNCFLYLLCNFSFSLSSSSILSVCSSKSNLVFSILVSSSLHLVRISSYFSLNSANSVASSLYSLTCSFNFFALPSNALKESAFLRNFCNCFLSINVWFLLGVTGTVLAAAGCASNISNGSSLSLFCVSCATRFRSGSSSSSKRTCFAASFSSYSLRKFSISDCNPTDSRLTASYFSVSSVETCSFSRFAIFTSSSK
mmetsp:Transcript_39439/g.63079  ORF Transcript_39439/g.63079 Transcript_39439/m.63079 type:complete len:206 (-) Transcript_39439:133-750(-)